MVITTLRGVANLESATGLPFDTLVSEWLPALYTDNLAIPNLDARLTVPSWNLRDVYQSLSGGYPLVPTPIGFADGTTNYSARSGSGRFFLLQSTGGDPALSLRRASQSGAALNLGVLNPRTVAVRTQ